MKLCAQLRVKGRQRKLLRHPLIEKAMRAGSGALRVAIDCSLDQQRPLQMSDKEVVFLAKQVSLVYSLNYQFPRPCHLHLVGLSRGGRLDSAFRTHISNYHSMLVTKREDTPGVCFHGEEVVYLSPDSSVECESVEGSAVYVVGGLVDRTVDKGVTESYARSLGFKTAKLPIQRHIRVMGGQHLCLPVNIVVGILLSVHADGDWTEALSRFIPQRKQR